MNDGCLKALAAFAGNAHQLFDNREYSRLDPAQYAASNRPLPGAETALFL
jgi:hypothetical protein